MLQYFIAFLEGIITFISPCLLPMLPIYASYFAGGGERNRKKTLIGALGFVLGFTTVFVALGALAGTLGSLVNRYQTAVNLVCGAIVIIFGLNFIGILKLNLFRGGRRRAVNAGGGFFAGANIGWIIFFVIVGLGLAGLVIYLVTVKVIMKRRKSKTTAVTAKKRAK